MKRCKYYREESPHFLSFTSEGLEITMIPVCDMPGLRELGAPSDIVIKCDGNRENCPYKDFH